MLNIIESTRAKLVPFLGAEIPVLPAASVYTARPVFTQHDDLGTYARLVRKIPRDNYENLSKLVPLSWI